MSGGLIDHIVTGSERFPGHFIGSFHDITLSSEIIKFLVQYYSEIYPNYDFYDDNQLPKSEKSTLVSSTAQNEIVNWPGIIKFFIEYRVSLPNSKTPTSHYLAIVDWYRRDPQKQGYFYVKSREKIFKNILSTNADGTYYAELWEDRFVERGIVTILPIQRIIGRFVKSNGITLPGSKKKFVANLNTLSTSIASLTQSVNEMKTILNSSDMKSQLEITKNSIDSLKRRFDIYEQNQNEFVTTIQHISSEHGIKIQRLEDTLMTATTTLENLLTSTSALQDTTNNMLSHIQ
ncbi:4695_t:CDS:2, partial [Racocetra persica]